MVAKSSRRHLKWSCARTGVMLAAAIVTGIAAYAQSVAQASPAAISLVESTCTDILLLRRGTVQFSACTESLIKTLRDGFRRSSIQTAITACGNNSLREGTAEFATCVLDHRNRLEAVPLANSEIESVVVTAGRLAFPSELKPISFVESTPTERRRKVEYACAQLGLVPGLGAFSQCVADLSMALHAIENSPG